MAGQRRSPLEGITVLEFAEELGAFAGRFLAGAGARVIKVEPPGGSELRGYGPFVDDKQDPEGSLFFAFYNAAKESVVLDLESEEGRTAAAKLADGADVLIDGLGPGRLEGLGLGYEALRGRNEGLIYVSMTPFGREGPYADYKSSDLVGLAMGGPLFDCGYDDHEIPPIRGGGNQAFNTAAHLALNGILLALLWRQKTGRGQLVDVSMHLACMGTIELSNLYYIYNRAIIQRQTCRHAAPVMTHRAHYPSADGKYVWGFGRLNDNKMWEAMKAWLREKDLILDFDDRAYDDPAYRQQHGGEIFGTIESLAAVCTAEEFYHRSQACGLITGVIRAPSDLLEVEHFRERGFWVEVENDAWSRPLTFPGFPIRFTSLEGRVSRPPHLGEHTEAVLAEFGA